MKCGWLNYTLLLYSNKGVHFWAKNIKTISRFYDFNSVNLWNIITIIMWIMNRLYCKAKLDLERFPCLQKGSEENRVSIALEF